MRHASSIVSMGPSAAESSSKAIVGPMTAPAVERAIVSERRAFARSAARFGPEAAVLDVGGGCAVYTGEGLFSNRAFGLGLTGGFDQDDLDQIEQFYADRGHPAEIEVASFAEVALVCHLADRGYRVRQFRNIFARSLEGFETGPGVGVDVDVVGEHNRHLWSSILIDGFGYEQPDAIRRVERWNAVLSATEGLTAFVAGVGPEPAAAASVFIEGSVAVLGGAATLPNQRRLGAQTALIAARLRLAAENGCTLAVVTADPGGTSARNSERAGFNLVCTHAVMAQPTGLSP